MMVLILCKEGKPHVPRRGTSQPEGVGSSSVAEYTGDQTTIIMNPVPVSQVPFQEIQDNRASLASNLASPGNPISPSVENEEVANPMPMAANLGENVIANSDDKLYQSPLALNRACQLLDEEIVKEEKRITKRHLELKEEKTEEQYAAASFCIVLDVVEIKKEEQYAAASSLCIVFG
nr:uncharacterized protein LOC109183622 [Ipomoea trifida]